MNLIYKYPLRFDEPYCPVNIPGIAKFLTFKFQNGEPTVWYEVDPKSSEREYRFIILGTGFAVPLGYIYLGTDFIGRYVWHVYRKRLYNNEQQ